MGRSTRPNGTRAVPPATRDRGTGRPVGQDMRPKLGRCLAFVALLGAACEHGVTSPAPGPSDVSGSWEEDFGGLHPGSEFLMALQDSASVVKGSGTWAMEAGAGGSLVVSGTALGDSVHLQVVFVADAVFGSVKPDTARLEGAFSSRDRIDAQLVRANAAPQSLQLVRLRIGDPP